MILYAMPLSSHTCCLTSLCLTAWFTLPHITALPQFQNDCMCHGILIPIRFSVEKANITSAGQVRVVEGRVGRGGMVIPLALSSALSCPAPAVAVRGAIGHTFCDEMVLLVSALVC